MGACHILVLEDGKLAGLDSHDRLMETCPAYREIALSQSRQETQERSQGKSQDGPQDSAQDQTESPREAAKPAAGERGAEK